jgi:hypothetical protein
MKTIILTCTLAFASCATLKTDVAKPSPACVQSVKQEVIDDVVAKMLAALGSGATADVIKADLAQIANDVGPDAMSCAAQYLVSRVK